MRDVSTSLYHELRALSQQWREREIQLANEDEHITTGSDREREVRQCRLEVEKLLADVPPPPPSGWLLIERDLREHLDLHAGIALSEREALRWVCGSFPDGHSRRSMLYPILPLPAPPRDQAPT